MEFESTSASTKLERTDTIEVYDDFPNPAIFSTAYKNTSGSDLTLDKVVAARHVFDASFADAKAKPFEMRSFQGASMNGLNSSPVPNHANLQLAKSRPQNSISTTTFGTPQFGCLTAARPPRHIQFALKFYY